MGTTQEPLNFVAFWTLLGRLAAGLMRQRANGELTLIFSDGHVRLVRVNRQYLPENLPEI